MFKIIKNKGFITNYDNKQKDCYVSSAKASYFKDCIYVTYN